MIPAAQTIYLETDLQTCFIGLVSPRARAQLAEASCAVIGKFRKRGIKTVHVACLTAKETPLYPRRLLAQNDPFFVENPKLLKQLGLLSLTPEGDDLIALKTDNDALAVQELADLLILRATKHVLVGGCLTSLCVLTTMQRALWLGYACTGLTDLMGNGSGIPFGYDPAWHQAYLKKNLVLPTPNPPRLTLEPSARFLARFDALGPRRATAPSLAACCP